MRVFSYAKSTTAVTACVLAGSLFGIPAAFADESPTAADPTQSASVTAEPTSEEAAPFVAPKTGFVGSRYEVTNNDSRPLTVHVVVYRSGQHIGGGTLVVAPGETNSLDLPQLLEPDTCYTLVMENADFVSAPGACMPLKQDESVTPNTPASEAPSDDGVTTPPVTPEEKEGEDVRYNEGTNIDSGAGASDDGGALTVALAAGAVLVLASVFGVVSYRRRH